MARRIYDCGPLYSNPEQVQKLLDCGITREPMSSITIMRATGLKWSEIKRNFDEMDRGGRRVRFVEPDLYWLD